MSGILSQISFKKESTWGTAVVPDKSIAVRPTGGISINQDIKMVPGLKGNLYQNQGSFKGNAAYEGSYAFDLFADYVGHFLLSAHGVDTVGTHSGESIVYDHVFSDAITKPSYTIEQAILNNVRRFAGAIVSGYKITGALGEMLMFEPTIIAKSQAAATAITGAFTTVPAFNHAQVAVKIGGSTIGQASGIEINYKSGVEMRYALGSNDPYLATIKDGANVTGKVDLYLDSTTTAKLTNYINHTNESIELVATGGAIGSAAAYALSVLIPKAVYTAADTPIGSDTNMLSLSFDSIPDPSTGKLIVPTLTNLVASY
jgi:hypothetical protein